MVDGAEGGLTRMEQLGLDRAQRRLWVDAWRAHREEVLPTLDELSDLRASLRVELARESPDAETVGRCVIAIRELVKSLATEREALDGSLEDILDHEQRERYEELERRGRREAAGRGAR